MKKKLILFMPSIEGGGVEKNFILVSNYLAKKLTDISIITASKKYSKKFDKKINIICPKSSYWDNLTRRIKYIICLFLLIFELKKNKEIIVFCFQANIYCILLCKLFKTKIVIRSNSSPSGWSKNLIKIFIYKKVLKMADKIMVNSLEFKKQFKNRFYLKTECIYNPLNITEISKLSKNRIKENFFDKTKLKIINIGRFVDQKDHLTLLNAINHLKEKINLKLIIIGGGPNKKKILNYIKSNNLTKIIKIKNFTHNPYPYFLKADLFILSSLYEGLPNVLLESLALNKFVISSNCPTGPSEILDNNKGGLLFRVGDYKDLVSKISFFNSKRKECGKRLVYARKRLHRFDYHKNLKKYYDLVKSMM
jgi:glycosyltransferase involved in cell wall biosynthesis